MIGEFKLIEDFFKPIAAHRKDVILGIGDDAALMQVPSGKLLVDSTDTLVEDVHFSKDTPPHAIGYKSLAVNLSDIAAMGATPCWVSLSITLSSINENWLTRFTEGFSVLMQAFNLQLIGGDTTHGPLSITVHVLGIAEPTKILRRDGAKAGDAIYVTGTLGDAAFALNQLQNAISPDEKLLERLYYPTPRTIEGSAINSIANAAIDISDGLLGDLNHILRQSQVGATLFTEKLPLSDEIRHNNPTEKAIEYALSGGDDYELCFTVSPHKEKTLQTALEKTKCRYTYVGNIQSAEGLYLETLEGRQLITNPAGYQHF